MINGAYIALTALESHWGEPGDTCFLGEWCRLISRKHIWEKFHPEVIDQIRWDAKELENSAPYCNKVGFYLIEQVGKALEDKYKQNLPQRFYEQLLAPWALSITGAFYTRYRSIKLALETVDNPIFITCDINHIYPPHYYITEYTRDLYGSPGFNQFLFSDIIRCMGLPFKENPMPIPEERFSRKEQKSTWKRRVLNQFLYLLNQAARRPYFVLSGVPLGETRSLRIKSKGSVVIDEILDWPHMEVEIDNAFRARKLELPESEFSQLLGDLALRYLPWGLAEGFVEHLRLARRHPAYGAEALFTSYAPWGNLPWLYIAALSKAKVGMIAHGGDYSICAYHQTTAVEKIVADVVFEPCPGPNELPNPGLFFSQPQVSENRTLHALFVALPSSPLPSRLGPYQCAQVSLEYARRRSSFFDLIDPSIAIVFRPFFEDTGLINNENLFDKHAKLSFQNPRNILFSQALADTQMFISDACWGTLTITEAITSRKPCVLLFHADLFPVSEKMKKVVSVLEDAKIVHKDIHSAAEHLNEVFFNPQQWWNSQKVQSALDCYCDNFCISVDGWEVKWLAALENLPDAGRGEGHQNNIESYNGCKDI